MRPVLRGAALLAFAAVTSVPVSAQRVRTGIEVLLTDSIHLIRGKRVGLITNHTGVAGPLGKSSADLLAAAPGVKLTALFGPEHGIRGIAPAGDHVASGIDSATGVVVHSLYGATRVPTPEMLKDVDILLYDIMDVGSRTYTYPWTMALSAEAAGKPFFVLDRPNPVRNDRVEGGVLDVKYRSFIGQFPVAVRYGLTAGELARYLVGSGQIKANITVIPMQGYRANMWWNETGLPWINPSPNIRSLDAALLYTGTVYFEGTNLNEGRGMSQPFQMLGAPWLTDAGAIAKELNAMHLPGVVFDSSTQTIEKGFGYKHEGQTVPVLITVVSDRDIVKPHVVALHMLRTIYKRHQKDWAWREQAMDRLFGTPRLREAVEREGGIEALIPILDQEAEAFARAVAPYRLYR